jgi:hypothetical protein
LLDAADLQDYVENADKAATESITEHIETSQK